MTLDDVKLSYVALICRKHAQLIIADVLLRWWSSELLFLESVGEHVELGNIVARALGMLNRLAEGNGTLHIVGLTSEDLELIPFTSNSFNQFSGTLLEAINAVVLTGFLKLLKGPLHEGLSPGHEVLLAPLNLIELESVDNVVNSLGILIVLNDIIGGDSDLVRTLLNEGTADLKASVLHSVGDGVGIGDEFITGEKALVHSHS